MKNSVVNIVLCYCCCLLLHTFFSFCNPVPPLLYQPPPPSPFSFHPQYPFTPIPPPLQAPHHVCFELGCFHSLIQRTLHEECSLYIRHPAYKFNRPPACAASNLAIAGHPIKAFAAVSLQLSPMRHSCSAGDQLLFPSLEAALLHIQQPGAVDC